MSSMLTIAAIGGSGPKATAINFLKTEEGVRQWAWMSNDIASRLRPGMVLTVEQVSTGKTETTYIANGVQVDLKVPKQQLFLGGHITVAKPDAEPLAPVTVTFADDAATYAAAYDAKKAAPAAEADGDEPF